MNELEVFEASKKRTLIAMQEWLRTWQLPLIEPIYCPKCQSNRVNQRSHTKNGKTHRCQACKRDFSLEELPECRCTYPGQLLKCLDCKHYKAMMTYVEQRKADLAKLSEDKINAMFYVPDFYKRDLTRRSPNETSSHASSPESPIVQPQNVSGAEPGIQLNLFESQSVESYEKE